MDQILFQLQWKYQMEETDFILTFLTIFGVHIFPFFFLPSFFSLFLFPSFPFSFGPVFFLSLLFPFIYFLCLIVVQGTNYIMWYPFNQKDNNALYRFHMELF